MTARSTRCGFVRSDVSTIRFPRPIRRSQNGSTTYSLVADSTGPSYVDSGLQRRTSYTYKVRAYDAALNLSAFSNPSTAKTT